MMVMMMMMVVMMMMKNEGIFQDSVADPLLR
jgi:hypothetical protein